MAPKGYSKYSEEALEGIKQALMDTGSICIVAKKLGTTYEHVEGIVRRHRWRLNLKRKPTVKRGFSRQTIEKAHRMAAVRSEGATLEEIGKKFKVTRERVRQLLKEIGVETCRRGNLDVCQAVKMREEGYSLTEIGERFGVHPSNVGAVLRTEWIGHIEKAPLKKRPYRPLATWDIKKAHELYLQGKTFKEIKEEMGLKIGHLSLCGSLRRYRKHLGWEKRK